MSVAPKTIQELVESLKAGTSDPVSLSRPDLDRLLVFLDKAVEAAERANTLLVNAYSEPGDEKGVRLVSEDAVRLQWALREIGVGDDSGEPCFTV